MTRTRRVPTARLPRNREHYGRGIVVVGLVHSGVVLALVFAASATQEYFRAIGDPGSGGGGGGGGSVVRYVELPSFQRPAGTEVETPTEPTQQAQLQLPTPQLKPTLEPESPLTQNLVTGPVVAAVRLGQGPGSGGGPGAGTGSGGGIGSGQGTGVGSGRGPGSGGEGGSVLPPDPVQLLLPPTDPPGSVAGKTFSVDFWVDATGRVTRVEITPEMEDAGYRRRFVERMVGYRFRPAHTLDGAAVNGHFVITFTL